MSKSSWAAALLPHAPTAEVGGLLLQTADDRYCGGVPRTPAGIAMPMAKLGIDKARALARSTQDPAQLARFAKDSRKGVRLAVAENPALSDADRLVLVGRLTDTEEDTLDMCLAHLGAEHLPVALGRLADLGIKPATVHRFARRIVLAGLDERVAILETIAGLEPFVAGHEFNRSLGELVCEAMATICPTATPAEAEAQFTALWAVAGAWRSYLVVANLHKTRDWSVHGYSCSACAGRSVAEMELGPWVAAILVESLDEVADAFWSGRENQRSWGRNNWHRQRKLGDAAREILVGSYWAGTLFGEPHPVVVSLLAFGATGPGEFWDDVIVCAEPDDLIAVLRREDVVLNREQSVAAVGAYLSLPRHATPSREEVVAAVLANPGLDLDEATRMALLRHGSGPITSRWIRGELGGGPRPGEITALVTEPGRALENPSYRMMFVRDAPDLQLAHLCENRNEFVDEFVDAFGLRVLRGTSSSHINEWLAERFTAALGTDPAAWELALTLSENWEAGLTALLDTVRATLAE